MPGYPLRPQDSADPGSVDLLQGGVTAGGPLPADSGPQAWEGHQKPSALSLGFANAYPLAGGPGTPDSPSFPHRPFRDVPLCPQNLGGRGWTSGGRASWGLGWAGSWGGEGGAFLLHDCDLCSPLPFVNTCPCREEAALVHRLPAVPAGRGVPCSLHPPPPSAPPALPSGSHDGLGASLARMVLV